MTCSTLFLTKRLSSPCISVSFFCAVIIGFSTRINMSFERSNTTRRSRNPSCTLCCNHGVRSELKGHKYNCPFNECECRLCDRGRERREVMRKQVKLRRQQMKQIYAKGYTEKHLTLGSSSKMETARKVAKTFEGTYTDELKGSRNSGTCEGMANSEAHPPVSTNHQSSQTMQNTAPYNEYSRFPTHVNLYPQNNESFAYYLSLSPPGISTPPDDHSPSQRISSLLGQLSISENSAFVKFSPRNRMLLEAGINATESWPSEIKESKEAALALASLQHKKV